MSTTGVLSLEGERVENGSVVPHHPVVKSSVLSLCVSLRLSSPLGRFSSSPPLLHHPPVTLPAPPPPCHMPASHFLPSLLLTHLGLQGGLRVSHALRRVLQPSGTGGKTDA